mgnify:CR=1 FL=1
MQIRNYNKEDILLIENLGKKLHNNYKVNLDVFSNIYICTVDNNIIGFISYSIMYERAEILDIFIDIKYRNRGYASKLIKKVLNQAYECNNISLEVDVENKSAINLYKKFGFEIKTVRKNYYDLNDAYLMVKELR